MTSATAANPTLELELKGVGVTFAKRGGRLNALEAIELDVARSRFISIVGPNGCGKSTLVRLIAGLLRPTEGVILHRGKRVTAPDKSRLLMFQQPTLFPWKSVYKNIDFALRSNGVRARHRRRIIEENVAIVGLEGFEHSFPRQLSGGMLQRAELARALSVRPDVLLMDEPFASVDSLSRLMLQEELSRIRAHRSSTFVMVTHDVPEAVFLADHVILMSRRPGTVKEIFDIGWDGPRTASWRHTSRFASLSEEILASLREEMDVAAAATETDTGDRAKIA